MYVPLFAKPQADLMVNGDCFQGGTCVFGYAYKCRLPLLDDAKEVAKKQD